MYIFHHNLPSDFRIIIQPKRHVISSIHVSFSETDVLPLQYKAKVTPSPPSRTTRLLQQSVTLHAYMEGYPRSTDEVISDTGWFIWGITEAQLPILVGAAAGGFVLMFTLLGLIIWRCCQHQKDKEKQYCKLNDTYSNGS